MAHGNRVTRQPGIATGHPVTLWFSGGSAAFGIAQRDDRTIASQLVALAEADGIELHVENIAHVGFDFFQELTYSIEPLLAKGLTPDLLVIYNGFNDAAGEVFTDFLEGIDPDRADSPLSEVDLDEVNRRAEEFLAQSGGERSELGRTAGRISADRYGRLQEQLSAIAPGDTQVHYFFQPDALVNVEQIRAAYGQVLVAPEEISRSPLATALETMTSELGSRTHDLRPLFDADGPPAFVGIVHQNEPGAEVVAQEIYESLRPALAELAR